MRYLLGLIVNLAFGSLAFANTTYFESFDTLCEAASHAKGGEVLVLRDGQYAIKRAVTLRKGEGGNKEKPLTIRAESNGGVILKGPSTAFAFKPGSAHVVISDFDFQVTDETAIKLEGANHIRVTNCDFSLKETSSFDWLVISGANSHHNRVDHCRFSNKVEAGNFISVNGDDKGNQSQHDRIDHNQFINTAPRIKNEKEAVRIGWSGVSLSDGFTIIENNYFERCDGDPEVISIKSCQNIIRQNLIRDSMGVLSLRHGNGSVVHSNVILGQGRAACGGIRVYGDDHRIYNNYLANLTGNRFNAALAITNGDADMAQSGKDLSKHYRPRRIQVAYNSFINNAHSIEIGYGRSGKKAWKRAPSDILFANNLVVSKQAKLIKIYAQPIDCDWKSNLFWHTGGKSHQSLIDCLSKEAMESSLIADPKLIEKHGLLLPGPGSPAINSASSINDIQYDLAGTNRTDSPDIGALESQFDEKSLMIFLDQFEQNK